MSTAYDKIGLDKARTLFSVCKAIGKTITLNHLNKTFRELYALPLDEDVSVVAESGIQTETRTRVFRIPIQDGFDVTRDDKEPLVPGDCISFNGRNYYVLQGGVKKVSNDYIYEAQCIQRKRAASGIGA
jgi:hypothetical protein